MLTEVTLHTQAVSMQNWHYIMGNLLLSHSKPWPCI